MPMLSWVPITRGWLRVGEATSGNSTRLWSLSSVSIYLPRGSLSLLLVHNRACLKISRPPHILSTALRTLQPCRDLEGRKIRVLSLYNISTSTHQLESSGAALAPWITHKAIFLICIPRRISLDRFMNWIEWYPRCIILDDFSTLVEFISPETLLLVRTWEYSRMDSQFR